METDLAVVGAGAAGLSAAIYASRNGLHTEVFEGGIAGGMTLTASKIENYPGFEEIQGQELMERFVRHARRYVKIHEGTYIESVEGTSPFVLRSGDRTFQAMSLILATGAKHRKLGIKGEETFAGRGVSYCATCDGFFFRGKRVLVVGGGNTAVMDVLYLHDLGVHVTLVHRRDKLRAEQALQDALFDRGIPVIWSSTVREIRGEQRVESVILESMKGETEEVPIDGVFIAVGHIPSNELARQLGLKLDSDGYVVVDRGMRTTKPYVYAAGDLTGGLMQIVTAASEGAIAATSAYEDLRRPYWSIRRQEDVIR